MSSTLRSHVVVAVIFVATSATLIGAGNADYPNLHTVLDTGICVCSGVLALKFAYLSSRLEQSFPRWLAISFALTSALELVHVLVTVEWFGTLAPITRAASNLRPSTWPPAAYVLPLGVGLSLSLFRKQVHRFHAFAPLLIVTSAGLLALAYVLPRYTAPTLLGITRPLLVLVPILWLFVGWLAFRARTADRLMPTLVVISGLLIAGNVAMLYSRAPHDTAAMVAHLGRFSGYLVLLLSLMEAAAFDLLSRVRAERELTKLNAELEDRVGERTARLSAQLARLKLLDQVTRAAGEHQDAHSIYQAAVGSLEDHLPVQFACVLLLDPDSPRLTVSNVGTLSAPLAQALELNEHAILEADENGLSRCLQGRLVYEPDITVIEMSFAQRLARVGLRALVIAPLRVDSKAAGVLIAARTDAGSFSSIDCEFVRQLGEHIALAANQAKLYDALQVAYDDLRQTQDALMQQERLRALGQMASGIAHDINNAISPVALYTESMMLSEPGLSAQGREDLAIVQRAIKDVAQTVARMREFTRPRNASAPHLPVDVNELVTQVINLTRARWFDVPQQRGIAISLEQELASRLPALPCADNEIRDALTNLIFNAIDAMPAGGRLTIRTLLVEPSRIAIEVADSGCGMNEETQRVCLEPFFTTKGVRGTGLGLAMVYGTVQRHAGQITIDSAPGRGTTFRLTFDVSSPRLGTSSDTAGTEAASVPPAMRILIVDDDPLLIRSLRDTLKRQGHETVTAESGQDALDLFRNACGRGEHFDAVITDLGMPRIDGRQVARGIKEISPGTPVILLTGWGHRMIADGDVPAHVDQVLSKPPTLIALHAALVKVSGAQPTQTPVVVVPADTRILNGLP